MGRRVRRRQDDHGTARSAHPSLPYPGDWQRQLPLQGERCSTQNTEGKTRHLTVPASRETIVQPGQFSMTIPGQFLATINNLRTLSTFFFVVLQRGWRVLLSILTSAGCIVQNCASGAI